MRARRRRTRRRRRPPRKLRPRPFAKGSSASTGPRGRKFRSVPMSHRTEAVRQGEAALTKSLPRLLKAAGKQAARVASKAFAALGKASDQEDVADDAIAGVDWAHIAESGMAQIVAVASDGARH